MNLHPTRFLKVKTSFGNMESYEALEKYLEANQTKKFSTDSSYVCLNKTGAGICARLIDIVEFNKFDLDTILKNAGILKDNDGLDILVSCAYDDKTLGTQDYHGKVGHLKDMKWYHLPNSAIETHPFLKKLFETEESEDAYQIAPSLRNNELGLDESELLEGMHSDAEETRQNEFDSENRLEDDFEDDSG
jgi:hypothetical protein